MELQPPPTTVVLQGGLNPVPNGGRERRWYMSGTQVFRIFRSCRDNLNISLTYGSSTTSLTDEFYWLLGKSVMRLGNQVTHTNSNTGYRDPLKCLNHWVLKKYISTLTKSILYFWQTFQWLSKRKYFIFLFVWKIVQVKKIWHMTVILQLLTDT